MTIANSTPLSYMSRVKQPTASEPEPFIQKRNAEQETFILTDEVGPLDGVWARILKVARASSAIPFVFPMIDLPRIATDAKQYLIPPNFEGTRTFWYYDGGTYNNLPIDLACRQSICWRTSR
jgi:predicted acylesterase/phospholipase RssA